MYQRQGEGHSDSYDGRYPPHPPPPMFVPFPSSATSLRGWSTA